MQIIIDEYSQIYQSVEAHFTINFGDATIHQPEFVGMINQVSKRSGANCMRTRLLRMVEARRTIR